MPVSCPYCHGPLTDDAATQARPARCPHCGNALPSAPANFTGSEETGNKPSLATFLKAEESATEPELPEPVVDDQADVLEMEAAAAAPDAGSSPSIEIPQTKAPEPETTETTEAAAQSDAPDLLNNTEPAPETDSANEDQDSPASSSPTQAEAEALTDVTADQTDPAPTIAAASPGFIHDAQPSSRTTPWLWFALVLLTLILLLQIALADRNRLAADPDWRPAVVALCNVLGCSVPAWQEPKAFTMLDRNVRPNAQSPGTLDVTATFRNDARWAQAWPTVLVKLSDADGRTIGARAITPADYLADPAPSTELVPEQSARMAVQVHEPDGGAVAFTFEFR